MRGVSDQSGIDNGLDGRIDVLHMITGLNVGGAETMLARLLAHPALRKDGLSHQVLSLLPPGLRAVRRGWCGRPVRCLQDRQDGFPRRVDIRASYLWRVAIRRPFERAACFLWGMPSLFGYSP